MRSVLHPAYVIGLQANQSIVERIARQDRLFVSRSRPCLFELGDGLFKTGPIAVTVATA
jgi:hypothetical protein